MVDLNFSSLVNIPPPNNGETCQATREELYKMIGRTAKVAAPAITRRTFTSTRAQLSSPFHYPEGPRSNLPFNPKTRFFAVRYWLFMAVGFGIPFGEAVWQTYKN